MGCGGYTTHFWVLCTAAFMAFILAVVGHAVASGASQNQGELPLWYQIDTCQNTTGTISTTPTGEVSLCAKHVTSCPTLWSMYVARAPGGETETACPTAVGEQSEFKITLEPDDGFVGGVPYNPIFVLPTGASALISFKVEDGEGGTLLPTTNAELGPGTTYPWRELSQNRGAVSSEAVVTPAAVECSDTCLDESCTSRGDGDCDDGGPGSSRSLCPRGTDCSDCKTQVCTGAVGEVKVGGARRLATTESEPDASTALMQQGVLLGAQVEDAAEAAPERDERDEGAVPAPGSRRLLKGGSSSGGFSSSSRSSYSGSYSGSSRGYSTSGRTSSYSSGYSRSSSPTSYSTSYSSYRSGGYYGGSSYGSRGYYGGGRSYGYRYGYGGYGRSHSIYIVRPYYYGCYSCSSGRNCNSCSNCQSRRECNGEQAYTTTAPLDRYEFTDSKFTMELARWPAYLIIHNATVFTGTPGSASAYVTFFTESGSDGDAVSGPLLALAYLALVGILVACCCLQSRDLLKEKQGGPPTSGEQQITLAVAQPQQPQQAYYQPQQAYPQAGGYPQAAGYPQAGGMQMAMAQPMAQPMAQAYPQAAPMAQAYPQAAPMAQAYPQAAPVAMATAYVGSAPPSPPSPSEPVVEKKDE